MKKRNKRRKSQEKAGKRSGKVAKGNKEMNVMEKRGPGNIFSVKIIEKTDFLRLHSKGHVQKIIFGTHAASP